MRNQTYICCTIKTIIIVKAEFIAKESENFMYAKRNSEGTISRRSAKVYVLKIFVVTNFVADHNKRNTLRELL